MGHRDVIGADDTLENDLKFGVFFNPLDVLPSQVILDLVHEWPLLIIDITHLELVPQFVEQLQGDIRLEDCTFIPSSLAKDLRIDCDGKSVEAELLGQLDDFERVFCILQEVEL